MKKVFFSTFVACVLFSGSMAEALSKSRIFIVNQTGKTLFREAVIKQVGQKYAAKVKRKWGVKKTPLEGFTCVGRTCTENKRRVFWKPAPVIVTKAKKEIKPGKTVEIAKIDRDQPFGHRKYFSKKELPGGFKNPSPEKFKELTGAAWGYKVFPFEQIVTSLKGPEGTIVLAVASERVGLSAKAYAKSIGAGGIGTLGGAAAGAGAATGAALVLGASELAKYTGLGVSMLGMGLSAVLAPAAPYIVVGSIAVAGLAFLATVATLVGLDQKSGLTVFPLIKGDYEVAYSTNPPGKKRRTGGLYKDVYIFIRPKKQQDPLEG